MTKITLHIWCSLINYNLLFGHQISSCVTFCALCVYIYIIILKQTGQVIRCLIIPIYIHLLNPLSCFFSVCSYNYVFINSEDELNLCLKQHFQVHALNIKRTKYNYGRSVTVKKTKIYHIQTSTMSWHLSKILAKVICDFFYFELFMQYYPNV